MLDPWFPVNRRFRDHGNLHALAPDFRYTDGMNEIPPVPPVPEPKKGLPVLGWIGIGCGTILIIGVITISLLIGWCKRTVGDISDFQNNPGKAAAEMMVKFHPEVEKISQDDAAGEMTIRTKDGKEVTMSYKDISEGKFAITDAEGNTAEFGGTDLSKIPAWVPRLPGQANVISAFQNQAGGKSSGVYVATTNQPAEELTEFFKAEAETLKTTSSSISSTAVNGVETRNLTFSGSGKTLTIVITSKPGTDTEVSVGFTES